MKTACETSSTLAPSFEPTNLNMRLRMPSFKSGVTQLASRLRSGDTCAAAWIRCFELSDLCWNGADILPWWCAVRSST